MSVWLEAHPTPATTMKLFIYLALSLVCLAVSTMAACRCNSYTWVNNNGRIQVCPVCYQSNSLLIFDFVQGNCQSTRNRGRWCYVNRGNSCRDIQLDNNRRDGQGRRRQWSYEACAPGGSRPGSNNNQPVVQVSAGASVNTKPITRPINKGTQAVKGSSVKVTVG